MKLKLVQRPCKKTKINFLQGNLEIKPLECFIEGVKSNNGKEIMNSVVTKEKKNLLYKWKLKIADEISEKYKKYKSKISLSESERIAVSISFFFYKETRGRRSYDIDNFVKPVIDGIAKGLFSKDWEKEKNLKNNLKKKVRFNENDSIFKNLYFEAQNSIEERQEGVYITVCPL